MVDYLKAKSYTSQYSAGNVGYSASPFSGGSSSGYTQERPFSGSTSGGTPPISFAGSTERQNGGDAYKTFSVPERPNLSSSFLPEGAGNTVIASSGDIRGNRLNTFA